MPGMDAQTGKPLSGLAHVEQSVRLVLATPVGSRVGRRKFGSRVPGLLDGPLDGQRLADIQAAAVDAVETQEPRLSVLSARAESASADGSVRIAIRGLYSGAEVEVETEVAAR